MISQCFEDWNVYFVVSSYNSHFGCVLHVTTFFLKFTLTLLQQYLEHDSDWDKFGLTSEGLEIVHGVWIGLL